jgi:tRNA(Ile)-lysidine synthase
MNIFTGTGLSGLRGIPVRRDNIIRPLLSLSKKEILEYLKKAGIDFRIDSSNLRNDYRRNFIRNKILPLVRENLNPKVDDAVFRTSLNLADALNFNGNIHDYFASEFASGKKGSVKIDLKLCGLFGGVIPGEIIKIILKKYFAHQFEYDDYLKINSLVNNQKGKRVEISKYLSAVREEDSVLISRNDERTDKIFELKAGGKVHAADQEIGIEHVKNEKIEFGITGRTEFISADNLDEVFILRKWKPGDRFRPLGMRVSKKVSDFLTDKKISASLREKQLVLLNRNQIVWIVGLRIDERVKMNSKTKKAYKLWVN